MIVGAEIALLVIGLYALFAGKLPTNKKAKYVVQGWISALILLGGVSLIWKADPKH